MTSRSASRARERSTTRVYDDVVQQSTLSPDVTRQDVTSLSRTRSGSRRSGEPSQECIPCNDIRASSTLKKRLIVCCDGTFCGADKGKENNATNIALLTRVIANVGLDKQGEYVPQIVLYQSGIGTGQLTPLNKDLQGALGFGLNEKVAESFGWLANNYGPGDEIFIFGFSRGAYTARSLASFICQVGLLNPGMMDYFDGIFTAYKTRDRKAGEIDFKHMAWAQHRVRPGELGYDSRWRDPPTRYDWVRMWTHLHVKIKVVGVFDTVGSYGMSGWVAQPGQDVDWHATKLHPKIEYAFQALALDESRGNFPPTMFYLDQACRDAGTKLRQCWFPGYHGCIGGQSEAKYAVNSVSLITFAWMIDQLTRYDLLQINARALNYPVLDRLDNSLAPNSHRPTPPRNVQEAHERRIEWSDGILQETDTLFWQVASQVATQRWEYRRKPGEYYARDQRTGHQVDQTAFCETIHPSVWHRIQHRDYEPKSLPLDRWSRVRAPDGIGHDWIRSSRSGHELVCIPEYVIPNIVERSNGMKHWTGSLEQRIAPGDYLQKLDRSNGVIRGSGKRPPMTKADSGYGSYYDDEYLSVETIKLRSPSPRPSSRGSAREYYLGADAPMTRD